MANDDPSPWYALGRAIGGAGGLLRALDSNPRHGGEDPEPAARAGRGGGSGAPLPFPVTGGLAGAAGAVLLTALERWLGRRRPPFRRLVRGAAAGAGAAGILVGLRTLADRDDEVDLLDELLAGAGRGVIYASLMEPFMPGPPILRGALAGTVDFLVSPAGGAFSHLQRLSPARRIPVVSVLLEAGDAEDDPYVAFLLYGAALGLLYGDPDDDGGLDD